MPTWRRAALALALAAPCLAGGALAADYPAKPIKLVVPYAPGGGADAVARIVAKQVGDSIGQSIVVENKGGAGSIVGTDLVAKAEPDGYTLLLGQSGPISINPAVYKSLPYDPVKEFAPVTMTNSYPYVLVVNPKLPAKTLQEFVALAKSKPGAMNYGSTGVGAANHLVDRAVLHQGRAEDDPHPLSRHGAGGRRSSGRPAHHGVRRSGQRAAAHQVGQAARARRHQPAALAGRARGADHGRERLSRLRGAGLARHPGAGQDAAGDRQEAQRGDRQGARRSRRPRSCWPIRRCSPSAARRRNSPPSSRRTSPSGRRSRRRRT